MKLKYYRVMDHQRGCYFAVGYNAYGMKDLIEQFQDYISDCNEFVCKSYLRTWNQIAEHLQGVELESSYEPFEEIE